MLQFRAIALAVAGSLALAAPAFAGKLSIVIDDFGYRPQTENQVLALPATISVAVLPNAPHAREMATKAHNQGHEVLIHLPMAPLSKQPLEKDTLLVWLLAGIAAGLAILPLLSQGSGSSSGTATPLLLETVLATFIGAAFSRRRVVTIWGALLGAILVNALSNGLGLLGVNIFWMGAIKGGLILVVLAASAVRHKGGEA